VSQEYQWSKLLQLNIQLKKNNDCYNKIPNNQEGNYPTQSDIYNKPTKVVNVVQNECHHFHIDVQTETAKCETCLCYFCCFFGFFAMIFAVVFVALACSKSESNNSGGNIGFMGGNHHFHSPIIDYYCINSIVSVGDSGRIRVESRSNHVVDLGCMQMEEPHNYYVNCLNCGKQLTSGTKEGNTSTALMCGFLGIILLTGAILVFIFSK